MQYLNPNLCPTHGKVMLSEAGYNTHPILIFYCKECRTEKYNRITKLKLLAAKIKRQGYLSKHPNSAGMFEGL